MSTIEEHSPEVTAAITAELVRLTIGGRGERRIELWMSYARIVENFHRFRLQIGAALVPAFGRMVRAASDFEESMRRVQQAIDKTTEGDA